MLLIVLLILFKILKKCLVWNSRTTLHLSTDTFHFQLYGSENNEEDDDEEEILFDITRVQYISLFFIVFRKKTIVVFYVIKFLCYKFFKKTLSH